MYILLYKTNEKENKAIKRIKRQIMIVIQIEANICLNKHCYSPESGRPSDFQSGGGGTKKKGHFLEKKRAPTKGNLKANIYNLLDISIPLHCNYNYQG